MLSYNQNMSYLHIMYQSLVIYFSCIYTLYFHFHMTIILLSHLFYIFLYASQRVVAHEGVQPSVVRVGQVFASRDVERHVEIAHTFLKPFHSG